MKFSGDAADSDIVPLEHAPLLSNSERESAISGDPSINALEDAEGKWSSTIFQNLMRRPPDSKKKIGLVLVGVVTALYCIVEIGAAVYNSSLALLSDGFHNLSDVASVGIAYWAIVASKRERDGRMSYGWKRTTILGGLTNGCFLLSLCAYIIFEAVPRLIKPQGIEEPKIFLGVAGAGLVINTFGTIILAATGAGHSHSHGGHSHGKKKEEHGHSHGKHKEHEHETKKKKNLNKLGEMKICLLCLYTIWVMQYPHSLY